MNLYYQYFPSLVGKLTLIASDQGLVAILWEKEKPNRVKLPEMENKKHPILTLTANQLKEYFAGTRTSFDIPLSPMGTDFQKKVWKQLSKIPFGTAISYGELAKRLGDPNASRAVGSANGKNPISIVVPCHRVIGANGKLTGFAGGMDAKKTLLDHEGFKIK